LVCVFPFLLAMQIPLGLSVYNVSFFNMSQQTYKLRTEEKAFINDAVKDDV